jgi:chromosome segregation ATPase
MAHENRGELDASKRAHSAQSLAELALAQTALASAQSEIRRYESQKAEWQCQLAEKQLLLQTRAAEIEECKAEIHALRDRIRELESSGASIAPSITQKIEASAAAISQTVDSDTGEMQASPSGRRWSRRKQKRRWQIRKDR